MISKGILFHRTDLLQCRLPCTGSVVWEYNNMTKGFKDCVRTQVEILVEEIHLE